MNTTVQPLLTIGIIFKNEIRCLERCLKALKPLREAVPSELIMADTGSTDGSRKVAEYYADILFDFQWKDDFSAARNAVMDKASGQWYMTIDADEYLNSDISELVNFLLTSKNRTENLCAVKIRNCKTAETNNNYSDFLAVRLLRMSTGARYQGTIHESWAVKSSDTQNIQALSQTLLFHDGYVGLNDEQGAEKRKRNLFLLRKQLEKDPQSLIALQQYIESGRDEPDYLKVIKHACSVVEAKQPSWENLGPSIFRYAVLAAVQKGLPESEKWIERSKKWFPNSVFTQIDVEYLSFIHSIKNEDYSKAIQKGISYLHAINNFLKGKGINELIHSTLMFGSPYWEQDVQIYLSETYIRLRNADTAKVLLQKIDCSLLDERQTKIMLLTLGGLQRLSMIDTASLMVNFFESIKSPTPSEVMALNRLHIFYQTAALAFLTENIQEESLEPLFCRPSYTLFLPLGTENELGIAARIMQAEDVAEVSRLLLHVKDWENFPIEALLHSLICGIAFPFTEQPLSSEEIERLVVRMSENRNLFFSALDYTIEEKALSEKNILELSLIQSMILTAIRIYDWKNDNTKEGFKLTKLFVKVETEALHRFYSPELLCVENLPVLPSLHRFSWYCTKAFDSLNSGNPSGYIHELRSGMKTCPEANVIVEYLIKHTPGLQLHQPEVSDELLTLAAQVRKLLSSYPPNAPTIAAIKSSPVYQKVKHLIENNKIN